MKLTDIIKQVKLPLNLIGQKLVELNIPHIRLDSPIDELEQFMNKYNGRNFYILTDWSILINKDAILVAIKTDQFNNIKIKLRKFDPRYVQVEDIDDVIEYRYDIVG